MSYARFCSEPFWGLRSVGSGAASSGAMENRKSANVQVSGMSWRGHVGTCILFNIRTVLHCQNPLLSCGSGSSGTTGGTCHLNADNDNLLGSNEFEALEGKFAALDALAELEVGDIDEELFGDGGIGSANIELADHGHQLTTGTYTGCEALGSNGNTHNDGLFVGNLVEVNVEHVVLYRVELDFAHYSLVFYTVDGNLNEVDVGSVDALVDFLVRNEEVGGNGVALLVLLFAVHYAGNEALCAIHLGSLLAKIAAEFTADGNGFHFFRCVTLN